MHTSIFIYERQQQDVRKRKRRNNCKVVFLFLSHLLVAWQPTLLGVFCPFNGSSKEAVGCSRRLQKTSGVSRCCTRGELLPYCLSLSFLALPSQLFQVYIFALKEFFSLPCLSTTLCLLSPKPEAAFPSHDIAVNSGSCVLSSYHHPTFPTS